MDLYLARATAKVTQWELAKRTGISQAQISLFERGYREPSGDVKKKIADAIGIPVDAIKWSRVKEEEGVHA